VDQSSTDDPGLRGRGVSGWGWALISRTWLGLTQGSVPNQPQGEWEVLRLGQPRLVVVAFAGFGFILLADCFYPYIWEA